MKKHDVRLVSTTKGREQLKILKKVIQIHLVVLSILRQIHTPTMNCAIRVATRYERCAWTGF